jgi:uncharacterized alpha-E superfamily protein
MRIVEKADVADIMGDNLNAFIDGLQLELMDLHEQLATVYFQLPEELSESQEVHKLAASA